MFFNYHKHVEKNGREDIVAWAFIAAISQYGVEHPEDEDFQKAVYPPTTETEVKLLIAGKEIPFDYFFKRWNAQLDEEIARVAEKLIKEKVGGVIQNLEEVTSTLVKSVNNPEKS